MIFTVIWWILFFIMLPIGIKIEENDIGHAESAPKNHMIAKKIIITTFIAFFLSISIEYLLQIYPIYNLLEEYVYE